MTMRDSAILILGTAVATASCSGRYEVGTDPGTGGAAGTGGSTSTGTAGTGGAMSAGTGGIGGQAGKVDPGPSPRCGFTPDTGGGASGPSGSSAVVWTRIQRFLDDDSSAVPPSTLPSPPTSAWAGDQAMSILDGHLAAKTEARGLVRFLTAWLNLPAVDAGPSAAHTWSLKLLDPGATLTTLLAAPTGEPHRIGILTDRQVVATYRSISPRGDRLVRSLFCGAIPPPPASTPGSSPPVTGTTRRERLASDVSPPNCQGCHDLMDPAGYSLEHFDEMGNYRDIDNGKAVDSSGTIPGSLAGNGMQLNFNSIEDLAPQLAVSCVVARCFSTNLMSDAFGVAPPAMNPFTDEEVNHVANVFANSTFSIRELVKAIVGSPSFMR